MCQPTAGAIRTVGSTVRTGAGNTGLTPLPSAIECCARSPQALMVSATASNAAARSNCHAGITKGMPSDAPRHQKRDHDDREQSQSTLLRVSYLSCMSLRTDVTPSMPRASWPALAISAGELAKPLNCTTPL